MDSDWNSSSFSPGTLDCFLCKDTLKYDNGDRTEFINHLQNVHQTKFHHNLILAITFSDNDSLNDIVNQFEKRSQVLNLNAYNSDEQNKSVGKLFEEEFGIDADDEGLLIETDLGKNGSPNKSFDLIDIEAIKVEKRIHECESCEKTFTNRAALNKHTSKNHKNPSSKRKLETTNDNLPASKKIKTEAHGQSSEITEGSVDYEYIVSCSEYFKKNPKQITTKCNLALHSSDIFSQVDPLFPSGWKLREHKKSDGILEKHFLSPDGRVLKSQRAAMEYMSILGKYKAEKNKDDNGTITKKRNSIESSIENIKAIQKQNVERDSVIQGGITVRTDLMSVKREPMETFGDLWNHLKPVDVTPGEDASETGKSLKVAKKRKSKKQGSNNFAKSIKIFGDLWKHLDPVDDKAGEDGSKTVKKNKPEKKRKSLNGTPGESKLSRRSGVGVECPECHKVVGALRRHLDDIHSPPGHFPCPGQGCDKVFTSRNKQSSHTSRHCNPNKLNPRRKTIV